ncbi:hypothetical protein I316_02918 [Kwoniella heveanensis BCC8398]|uniref:Uncharacterized protein n=1 Tax=Kwoniella heveanensis BCC8398 TaxID=1296120 RepID=A0A1B9GWF7_9TREE|nr:hypothetical protein I316_02918 [Kwoniella heveanensis BCC8398]
MNQLSDLELVAQAMSASEPQPQSQPRSTATGLNGTQGVRSDETGKKDFEDGGEDKSKGLNGTQEQARSNLQNPSTFIPGSQTQNAHGGRQTSQSLDTSSNAAADADAATDTDLSSLGLDSTTLASLTSLLSLSSEDMQGLDEEGIMDLLAQFEAADGVADDLEGKLDRLLETLGGVEEEIVQDQAEALGQGRRQGP